MISMGSVTPQYEKPRRKREFKEDKLFSFEQSTEEVMNFLDVIRAQSQKQFDYIMTVGNKISELAKNEDLDELEVVINRNIDILPMLKMHIEEAFDSVLQFRFEGILEYFLENGYDLKANQSDCLLELCITSKFFADDAPLSLMQLLIKYGADVNAIEKQKYRTPLHYAAKYGILSFVQELIAAGAEIDPIDFKKRSPLNYALKKKSQGENFKAICKELQSKGGSKKWNSYVQENNVY